MTTDPTSNPILTPLEKEAMLQKALTVGLTAEETKRYIASTRMGMLAAVTKAPKTSKAAKPAPEASLASEGPLDFI